ncbi:phosphoglycerate mutase [Mangrovactinospora gilvigrisea]|uniref:Phosphoglycerate mutase n=1 Tax=Mangrovactinospora gilvigrisea TaxID=1428644 RepID=A0A1J7BIL9_9ACTN|nr:histidine phosphatase family protein [Mangrovactinospora gilvigrisea]OIV38429.1 phosphoglycerate mutase [Mangrovactinospora gilvigrisea]
MPTVLLVRHGRSTANSSGTLAGWTPGVSLDDRGRAQADALAARVTDAGLPLSALVTSPLDRCRQTVAPLAAATGLAPHTDERVGECHYGDWTGRDLRDLAKEQLWDTVQQHPSAAVFPGPDGESMRGMQQRAVDAVRDWNARIAAEHGPEAVYLVCSHGDVIKAIVADALGLHLDLFQRIGVEPGSLTAIRYSALRPFLLRLSDLGDLRGLIPPSPPASAAKGPEDAVVGGATGSTP